MWGYSIEYNFLVCQQILTINKEISGRNFDSSITKNLSDRSYVIEVVVVYIDLLRHSFDKHFKKYL